MINKITCAYNGNTTMDANTITKKLANMNRLISRIMIILILSVSMLSTGKTQTDAGETFKRYGWGLDFGIGSMTEVNADRETRKVNRSIMDLGYRYFLNFSPYFGWDIIKLKATMPVDFDDPLLHIMTGFRGKTPSFGTMIGAGTPSFAENMSAYGVYRIGYWTPTSGSVLWMYSYELELGINLTRKIFVGYAYNHLFVGSDEEYIKYSALRAGFNFGKSNEITRKEDSNWFFDLGIGSSTTTVKVEGADDFKFDPLRTVDLGIRYLERFSENLGWDVIKLRTKVTAKYNHFENIEDRFHLQIMTGIRATSDPYLRELVDFEYLDIPNWTGYVSFKPGLGLNYTKDAFFTGLCFEMEFGVNVTQNLLFGYVYNYQSNNEKKKNDVPVGFNGKTTFSALRLGFSF